MESRPRKRLSLKQRKLVFQSSPGDPNSNSGVPLAPSSKITPVSSHFSDQESPQSQTQVSTANDHDTKDLPTGLLYSGLCNLGNTCYINSVLQALRFCPGFSVGVQNMESVMQQQEMVNEDQLEPKYTLSSLLCKLWQRMTNKENTVSKPTNKINILSATKPDNFIAKLREENQLFDNKSQQDAQEMLRFLLTNLHETYASWTPPKALSTHTSPPSHSTSTPSQLNGSSVLKRSAMKRGLPPLSRPQKFQRLNSDRSKQVGVDSFFKCDQSPPRESVVVTRQDNQFIPDTFQGSLAYQTHCYECEKTTRRSELFLDISVPVSSTAFPGFPPVASPIKISNFGTSLVGPYSLSWCLSQFALREKLHGDNKYHCDECGRFTEAERSLLINELPVVMTIHLNRFTAQSIGQHSVIRVDKIGGNVAVPLALSFGPWTTEDCKERDKVYELFAAMFHSGSSCSSGHYTVCVRVRECVEATQRLLDNDSKCYQNSWLYFDDENVQLLSQSEFSLLLSPLSENSSTAYILFYTSQL